MNLFKYIYPGVGHSAPQSPGISELVAKISNFLEDHYDGRSSALSASEAAQRAGLERMGHTFNEKCAEVASLRAMLHAEQKNGLKFAQQVNGLQDLIDTQKEMIGKYQGEILKRDGQISGLEETVRQQAQMIAEKAKEIVDLQGQKRIVSGSIHFVDAFPSHAAFVPDNIVRQIEHTLLKKIAGMLRGDGRYHSAKLVETLL